MSRAKQDRPTWSELEAKMPGIEHVAKAFGFSDVIHMRRVIEGKERMLLDERDPNWTARS